MSTEAHAMTRAEYDALSEEEHRNRLTTHYDRKPKPEEEPEYDSRVAGVTAAYDGLMDYRAPTPAAHRLCFDCEESRVVGFSLFCEVCQRRRQRRGHDV